MKSIKQILTSMGLGLTDEQLDEADRLTRENYVTRAEADEKAAKIAALSKQVEDMGAQVQAAGDDADKIAALTKQVQEYQEAEAQRKEAEEAKAKREAFDQDFAEALKDERFHGARFANGITQKAIADAAYQRKGDNPDTELATIIEDLTKGQEGVWGNPQQPPKDKMPAPSSDEAKKRAELRDVAHSIFGTKANWD